MTPRTLQEKVGRMFLIGFHGLTAPDYVLDWLRQGRAAGVILFGRNVANPEQLAALTRQIHAASPVPLLIAIDQEGGTVARLREGFTESPGALAMAAAPDGEIWTERVSEVLAQEMHSLGINWTYAPAVDISYNAANPTVGTRSFGSDPALVSRMAAAAVRGFQAGGVAACAKHFPGLGNTAVDTHLSLAVLDTPVEQLLQTDLKPYRAAIGDGLVSVMTTHTKFTALDTEHPATLSGSIVRRLLREELGFDKVVTTDCMEMKAISDHYGAGESAVLAALAGIDLILFSHTAEMQQSAYDALLAAVQSGRVPMALVDDANARIEALIEQFAIQPDAISAQTVRSAAHVDTALAAALSGIVLLKQDADVFPLKPGRSVALIEFASILDSEVVESGGLTGLAQDFEAMIPGAPTMILQTAKLTDELLAGAASLAEGVDVLIVATRNAHLNPAQQVAAQALIDAAKHTILLCLRNPYDADALTNAATVLCSCGDARPSLQAVVEALRGAFVPSGKLTVPLEMKV